MQHLHLETCHSTQKYLIEKTRDNNTKDYLISCDFQTGGVGQHAKTWDCYAHTLCFSFNIAENELLNLTSLEMGVLCCLFFRKKYQKDLFLKWPNDILNSSGEKVGGILVNKIGEQRPIIGIGLNLFHHSEKILDYDIKAGFIFSHPIQYSKKNLAYDLCDYLKNNRLSAEETRFQWHKFCLHQNKNITITESDKTVSGIFQGIGYYGQAIVKNKDNIFEVYAGTLRINN